MRFLSLLFLFLFVAIVSINEGETKPSILTSLTRIATRLAQGSIRVVPRVIPRIAARLPRGRLDAALGRFTQRIGSAMARHPLRTFAASQIVSWASFIAVASALNSFPALKNVIESNGIIQKDYDFANGTQFFYCQLRPVADHLRGQSMHIRDPEDYQSISTLNVELNFIISTLEDLNAASERCNEEKFRRGSTSYPSRFDENSRHALATIASFQLTSADRNDFMPNLKDFLDSDAVVTVWNFIKQWAMELESDQARVIAEACSIHQDQIPGYQCPTPN